MAASRPKPRPKRAYHHGDLRRALLDASLALIEKHGVAALSLREVAREAGVSAAAPYHHFASKAELLGALAAHGFVGLARAMRDAVDQLGDASDPIARFVALGAAYVAFARSHPTEFRLMFRPGAAGPTPLPADVDALEGFTILLAAVDEVTALLPAGLITRDAMTATAWSLVHGAAELVIDGPLAEPGPLALDPARVGPLAVETLGTLLRAAVGRGEWARG